MEKRLLLAFILSFLVLFIWNLVYKPKPNQWKLEEPTDLKTTSTQEKIPVQLVNLVKEDTQVIENDKLKTTFSNIGGNLKNIEIKKYQSLLPVLDILKIPKYASSAFKLDLLSDSEIQYSFEDKEFLIKKIYKLVKDDYIVHSDIEIYPKTSTDSNLKVDFFTLDYIRSSYKSESQEKSLLEYIISSDSNTYRRSNAFMFSEKDKRLESHSLRWVGFRDRYFSLIIKPEFAIEKFLTDVSGRCLLYKEEDVGIVQSEEYSTPDLCRSANQKIQNPKNQYIWDSSLDIAFYPKQDNQALKLSNIIYYGPQSLELLKSYRQGFEEIMKFSDWEFLDVISKTIYNILHGIYKIIPNWGICILIISILIYSAMYPLTMKSMASMKKMQIIQPKIKKLQDQYKNNPEKLNKELIEFYKEHKINPLGGCLPLILQMPIFIGLYQVLWRSVSFKGAKFLWIKDLSEPDRFLTFHFSLPIIGKELNLLPILVVIIMTLQQKISAKNMTMSDPSQITQQKIMTTFMPFMIGIIFYKFSSGLCLYFTIFYSFSTLTQWRVYKLGKVST